MLNELAAGGIRAKAPGLGRGFLDLSEEQGFSLVSLCFYSTKLTKLMRKRIALIWNGLGWFRA